MTDLGRSSHSASAWVTATRTVVGGISLDDIVFSDNATARDDKRIFGCKVSAFIQADHNPLAVIDSATQIPRTLLERLIERSCGTGFRIRTWAIIPLWIHTLCKFLASMYCCDYV